MSLLGRLLGWLIEKIGGPIIERNQDRIIQAMAKVNEGGSEEDIPTIVSDYFYLLKAVYKKKGKPGEVKVDREYYDYYLLYVDGEPYDFDQLIRHNDQKNTGRKMEIEVLYYEGAADEIERLLNEKIQKEW